MTAGRRPQPWPNDLAILHSLLGPVCFYGVPLFSRGKHVGALLVGSGSAGALNPPW